MFWKNKNTGNIRKQGKLFELWGAFLQNYIFQMIWIIIIILLLIPIITVLIYYFLGSEGDTIISADGILSYCSASIGSIASLILAGVAIYQGYDSQKTHEELERQKRRSDIYPYFSIVVNKSEEVYEMIITNSSCNTAEKIYLFDCMVLDRLEPGNTKSVKFTYNEEMAISGVVYVESYKMRFTEKGYPKLILLQCCDIDGNNLAIEYIVSDKNKKYIVQETMYIDL